MGISEGRTRLRRLQDLHLKSTAQSYQRTLARDLQGTLVRRDPRHRSDKTNKTRVSTINVTHREEMIITTYPKEQTETKLYSSMY